MKLSKRLEDSIQKAKTPRPVLAELTLAVCQEYKIDPSAPSVLVSYLAPDKCGPNMRAGFYASIKRYRARYGADGYMVCNTSGHASTLEALEALAKVWLGASAAKDALREALR